MPHAILYHGFGIRGYRHLKAQFKEGCIYFYLVRKKKRCSFCHSFKVTQKGFKERTLRTLPIGSKKVFIVVKVRRFYCEQCGRRRFEDLLIAERKKHYTRALERYVRELCMVMTLRDVSRHTGLHWATVKAIDRRRLRKNLPSVSCLRRLRYLGIDEVSLKRRHRYLTLVVDLRTGRIVYVGEGRGERSLSPFFKRLRRLKVPLKAVSLDMWRPYAKAIRAHFPHIALVYDAFHILAEYSRMLDALRTQEYTRLKGPMKKIIKGTRFLLLQGQEKLSISAKKKLQTLLRLNRNLFIAYLLKEELRRLWRFQSREEAERFFFDWIRKALNSGIGKLVKLATRLLRHAEGILNYFRYPISTAMVEGINNKIKVIKRKAYGYRDVEYFKLKIYNLHLSRYSLL